MHVVTAEMEAFAFIAACLLRCQNTIDDEEVKLAAQSMHDWMFIQYFQRKLWSGASQGVAPKCVGVPSSVTSLHCVSEAKGMSACSWTYAGTGHIDE